MSPILKISFAFISLVIVSSGGYFLLPKEEVKLQPTFVTIDRDGSLKKTNSQISKDYSYYLVSPHNLTLNNSIIEVKEWWEWSFRNWEEELNKKNSFLSNSFQSKESIEKAFGETSKSLNNICKSLYSTSSSDITSTDLNKQKQIKNIFKFCSPLGEIPTLVKNSDVKEESSLESNTIGGFNKDKLVSTYQNNNFWLLKSEWFFRQSKESVSSKFFSVLLETNQPKKDQLLRQRCRTSYQIIKDNPQKDSPSETDVLKYCSFKVY